MKYDVESKIINWSKDNKFFGLILPNGWFGKPFDNQFLISNLSTYNNKFTIELSQEILLIITTPVQINVTSNQLSIEGFSNLIVQHKLYGSLKTNKKQFMSGQLIFQAY